MTDEHAGFDPAAMIQSAFEAYQRGDFATAGGLCTEVCEKAAGHSAAWMLRGLIGMQQFRYEEAIALFGRAAGIEPDPWTLANLGACHLKLGHLDEALAVTRSALSLKPDFVDAQINLATILHGMEKFEEALSILEQVDRLQPDNHRTYARLAATHAHLRAHERAEHYLEMAGRLTGKFPYYGVICFRKSLLDEIRAAGEGEGVADTGRVVVEHGTDGAAGHVIFACCDAGYFYKYGGNFVSSFAHSAARDSHLHLHVLDPGADFESRLGKLLDQVKLDRVTVTAAATPQLVGNDPAAKKTYYSCGRFMRLPALLRHYRRPVICLDIDSVVESTLDDIARCAAGRDLALVRRDPVDSPWLDYVANIIVANPTPQSISYFTLVRNYVLHYARRKMLHWHLDQIALYCVLHMLEEHAAPPAVGWISGIRQQSVWHLGHAYGHKLDDARFTRHSVAM